MRAAAGTGIGVDLTLEGPGPRWAAGRGLPPRTGSPGRWRPNPIAYGRFVRAVATRYSGTFRPSGAGPPLPRVSSWSLWNEPNYGTQLAPQAIDNSTVEVAPALYRGLVNAGWSALQATGHGGDTVLVGELAPRGVTAPGYPGNFSGMVPLRFLRALYCVDGSLRELSGQAARARGCPTGSGAGTRFRQANPGLFRATGYALHLYPFGAEPPNLATPGEPDYADLATVGRFEQTLDRIVSTYGSAKRFWIYDTEFGYKTNPPYRFGAALNTAAAYLNWAEYLHWRDPRIRSYDQYLLTDPPASGSSSFDTGIAFSSGAAKPSFAAFRLPIFLPSTSAKAGAKIEVWGCIRPAAVVRARTGTAPAATVQFASANSRSFRDLRSVSVVDPGGYFDLDVAFPASGTVRLAWQDPDGATIYSRPVAVTVR